MLLSLHIQNYAIITDLEIDFQEGFSIITGETGAGKSILMGALSLILGQRADASVLHDKSKKCIIEGRFDIKKYSLQNFFAGHNLDYEETTILRREINADGKSRAFINDTPVNLGLLKDMTGSLVDIHSQHQNLSLGSSHYQLQIIDTYAGLHDTLITYKKKFSDYKNYQAGLAELVERAAKAKTDIDYYQFQFDQLYEAKLTENEQEELEQELEVLTHAEEINSNLEKSLFLLSEKEDNIPAQLKEALVSVRNTAKYNPEADDLSKRLENTLIEIKDITGEIRKIVSGTEYNPDKIALINERLDVIYSLQKKHRVNSCIELLAIQNNLEKQISEIASYDLEIENYEAKVKLLFSEILTLAEILHKNREKALPAVEKDLVSSLKQLGMPHARIKIHSTPLEAPVNNGMDEILFTFSANKNIAVENISKVASGGELSRLMLSIKALLAEYSHLPTIIFDEIDTGVSGEIADKMGEIMKKMAKRMQVISITHLPQIASKGDHHYITYKTETKDTTSTRIRLLSKNERITEIARMLSGSELTEAAISNAVELLNSGK